MKNFSSFILLLLLSSSVFAWTIGPMNYQGRLLDNAGIPLTGSYNFKVRIYDAITGGTLKFSEQQNSIAVDDGVYSFLVSTGTSPTGTWDINLWNTPALYLEIEVNGQTLTPRHLLASTPFAFQANLALTTNNALALGGISSTQYGNTLASICTSGKGKWLELANAGAGACLGIGASFPGPTRVNWNTLTASNNFKDLDLSRADISGINFGSPSAANMTGTVFTGTTYSVAGMSGANLTSTLWDGAIATDASAVTVVATTNISKATMKNMDLSKWNFSSISSTLNFQNFSAAYLTACPAAVINYTFIGPWTCKLMRVAGTKYLMVGAYENLSMTSAAAITSFGEVLLDVDNTTFDNTDTSYASFGGVVLTESFLNGSFYGANMSHATLRNINFTNTNFNGTWTFVLFENVTVGASVSMNNNDFSDSVMTNVRFDNYPMGNNFTRAIMRDVNFTNGVQNPNFTDALLVDFRTSFLASNPTKFIRTRIEGDFNIASIHLASAPTMTFQDVVFDDAVVSGALTDVNFTSSIKFIHTVFKNLDLCSVSFPLAGAAPHTEFADVKWEGPIECPDGTDLLGIPAGVAPLNSNTCNYSVRTSSPIAVGSCTTLQPGSLQ